MTWSAVAALSVVSVYEDGEKTVTLRGDDIAAQFLARVENYIQNRFANN